VSGVAREGPLDRSEVEEPADLRLLDGAGEARFSERGGDVEQRAGDGRDGDAVRADVVGGERARAMQANAVPPFAPVAR